MGHSQNIYGGFAAQWDRGEGNEGSLQTGQLRRVTFTAKECILMSECSNEILEDGPGFQNWLNMGLIKAVGHFMDSAFISGNGVSKPIGIINSGCTIKVNRTTANQIAYADLVAMFKRLGGAFKNNSIWLINHDCIEQILKMTDTPGNLIWQVNARGGAASDIPTTIFGRPIYWTERVPGLGSEGDVVLCDPRQYGIGMRKEITLAVSPHAHFTQNTTIFRAIVRVDGAGLWDSEITPQNGTTTVSPFVILK